MLRLRRSQASLAAVVGSLLCVGGLEAACSRTALDGAASTASAGSAGCQRPFTPPVDPGPGGILITISGETSALVGFPYPPNDPMTATYMIDGWNWELDELIVVVDHITIWTNPNQNSSDQSQHGPMVAHVDGPFVVDLHKGGPLNGAGGAGEQALAIAALANQTDNGGAAFDPSTTYAFGFSTVPATACAIDVNLDGSEAADYATMVKNGYSLFYRGTATWAGDQSGGQMGFGLCSTNPQTDYASGDQSCAIYDFSKLPRHMRFELGFSTPTNYVNCTNECVWPQCFDPSPRGVQVSTQQSVTAQVTLETDRPFCESFESATPVHWNQIAAQYIGVDDPVAHTEDMKGVPFSPFEDRNGVVIPWQWCENTYSPPGNGPMSFTTLSVPIDPGGVCSGTVGQDFTRDDCPAIRDYYDFMRYAQSAQGHLHTPWGPCYVDRQYPSPGGGS